MPDTVSSQDVSEEKIFMVVEQQPQYEGGWEGMMNFIRNNLRYPLEARRGGHQGTVYITFVVGKDGQLADAKVLRGVSRALDEEALRVVKAMPPWIPGRQSGKPVFVRFNLPIKFSLGDGHHSASQSPFVRSYSRRVSPEFPGGEAMLAKFIEENLRPVTAILAPNKFGNRVSVTFPVDSVGNIGKITVVEGLGEPFDSEAIRIFSSMPKWIPGRMEDKHAGMMARAFVNFNTIKQRDIESSLKSFEKGNVQFERGKEEKAAFFYTEAIEKNPTHLDSYFNRAVCYLRLEKIADACADLSLIRNGDAEAANVYSQFCEEK